MGFGASGPAPPPSGRRSEARAERPVEAAAVPEGAIRAQLERLVTSPLLRQSERLTRFLRYVVEQHLAGEDVRLKETVLAVEIFDRQASYDSHVDAIVRVEARRLRDKLDKYYSGDGRNDPILIALPKGSYVPSITLRAAAPAPQEVAGPLPGAPSLKFPLRLLLAVVLPNSLAAVGLIWWLGSRAAAPVGAVLRLTSDSGLTYQPALSRDRKLLAYSSDRGGGALDIWVQQVPRGTPVRLTDYPGDETEPAFSPDSTLIAYRREGELDGIYTVPALGGRSTLLARGGYRPRFSADGSRLAFWTGERTFRTAKVFVIPVKGGTPLQIAPGLRYGAFPIWSPDGRHVVFVGAPSMVTGDPNVDDWDWWAAPVGGGRPVRMNARSALQAQGLRPPEAGWAHRRIVPGCFNPAGDLVFSALSGDQTNIWSVPVSKRDWQVRGPAVPLTFGAGRQDHPGMSADGALVFSALTQKSDIWSLPVDARSGKPRGPVRRLTSGPSISNRPSISRDGTRLAFIANRTGNDEVWARDLTTGSERAITATGKEKSSVTITPDGSHVAFGYAAPQTEAIFSAGFAAGAPVQLCPDCGQPRAWLPDKSALLYQRLSPSGLSAIGVVLPSGQSRPLISASDSALFSPSVSPDGNWIALVVRTPPDDHRIVLVPRRGDSVGARHEWVSITETGAWVDKPRWSPNGSTIYYVSDGDGFVCIWGRRVDQRTRRPAGEPVPMMHFHGARSSLASVYALDLSIAEDKLVFNVGEAAGNVWLAFN